MIHVPCREIVLGYVHWTYASWAFLWQRALPRSGATLLMSTVKRSSAACAQVAGPGCKVSWLRSRREAPRVQLPNTVQKRQPRLKLLGLRHQAGPLWRTRAWVDTIPLHCASDRLSPPSSTTTTTTTTSQSSSSTSKSTTTTSSTTSSSPSSTPGGSCSGVAAWASGVAYTGGQQVSYK